MLFFLGVINRSSPPCRLSPKRATHPRASRLSRRGKHTTLPTSKDELQSKLNLPGRGVGGSNLARLRISLGTAEKRIEIRESEIGVIEQVKELGPKLQALRFRQLEALV